MKMFTLLQAGEVVATTETPAVDAANQQTIEMVDPAGANDASQDEGQPKGGGMSMWIMLLLMFGVMWFFMIRPQRKQQKELQNFRNALQKGDKVVTIGGIYGTVVEIKDATVLIEVDNAVKIRVSKQALVKDFSDPQQ